MLALALGLLAASCGGDDDDGPAAVAPPDAPLYAEFAIDPDSERAEELAAIAEQVAGIGDPGAALIAELDAALAAEGGGLTYAEDVEPWLGDRAAVFVRSFERTDVAGGAPDFAAVIEVDDADAARTFLEQAVAADPSEEETRSYEGYDYYFAPGDGGVASGLIDDWLVVGTESSFMLAVDAGEGQSLAESSEYRERIEGLETDRVATIFVKPGIVVEAAIANEELERSDRRLLQPLLGGPLSSSVAAGITIDDDSLGVDLAAIVGDDALQTEAPLIERLPGDSWLAVAAPGLGPMFDRILDQVEHGGLPGARTVRQRVRTQTGIDPRADLLDWLGGAALFVEGTAVPGLTAGLIADAEQPEGPRRLLERARVLAERESGLRSSGPPAGAEYGFSLGLPGIGGGAEAGVVDDEVVAVFGGTVAGALDPERTLADDQRFADAAAALGDGFDPGFYLHLPSVLELAEWGGAADDPQYRTAARYLDRLESLIGGTRVDGDQVVSRWTLTLAGE